MRLGIVSVGDVTRGPHDRPVPHPAARVPANPAQTPLTVSSPRQLNEKAISFREYAGDHQRPLCLMDRAGLPLTTVLEQLDLLGEEVVPVLRREFEASRPTDIPSTRPPTRAGVPSSRPSRR